MTPERALRVGVTGARGLLGWHLRCNLAAHAGFDSLPADRATFASADALRAFVRGCDAIVHCAGMNRGDDAEIEATNVALVDRLVAACEAEGTAPHLVFTSSTHVERDTPYGRSKRVAAERLAAFAARRGARLTNLVLPNVFGEQGRPFYNSAVSTFCHQLARGETPTIHVDATIELLHAQRVADLIRAAIGAPPAAGATVERRPAGTPLAVSALLERLRAIDASYRGQVVPDLRDGFTLDLFNTYRSYLYPAHYPVALKVNVDARGRLFEAEKSLHGGQTFVSTTHPGVTRGNHWHLRKVERFLVIGGRARIRLRRLFDDAVLAFDVDGERPAYIDMPTMHTHNITNTGDGLLHTLFWSHEIFDPAQPDTRAEPVERRAA